MKNNLLKMSLGLVSLVCAVSGASAEQHGSYEFKYPFPSPDGKHLIIQGDFDGRWQLYTIETETGGMKRLHVSDGNDINPSWSNDGKRIAFVSDRTGHRNIYVLDLETEAVTALNTAETRDGHPKWSPDDKWVYFNRDFNPPDYFSQVSIVKARPGGGEVKVVTDSKFIETFPSPSPDGKKVVFVEWRPLGDDKDLENTQGDLVVVNLKDGKRTQITDSVEFNGYPHWGNDNKIYFSLFTEGTGVLYRINPDGSEMEEVPVAEGDVNVKRAVPSPDARTIYYNIEPTNERTTLHKHPLTSESGQ